jgi:hypothetical protein
VTARLRRCKLCRQNANVTTLEPFRHFGLPLRTGSFRCRCREKTGGGQTIGILFAFDEVDGACRCRQKFRQSIRDAFETFGAQNLIVVFASVLKTLFFAALAIRPRYLHVSAVLITINIIGTWLAGISLLLACHSQSFAEVVLAF